MRHNLTKLLMARWGCVDAPKYILITGEVNDCSQITQIAQMKRWAENIQISWIGAPFWVQRYLTGAICWYDYQVLINRLNRNVQLLSIVPDEESGEARLERRLRGRKYKKALRVHQAHVRRGAEAEIEEAEQALESASAAEGTGQRELQMLGAQLNFLREHAQGIEPTTNLFAVEGEDELDDDELFFTRLAVNDRLAFLEGLWNENTFVSLMWEFQGVLHFK
jgi:hypothetical protein